MPKITVKCHNCGCEVSKKPHQARSAKHNYCTKACYLDWVSKNRPKTSVRVALTCLHCEKTFERIPSQTKRGRGKFCSTKCHDEWRSQNATGERAPQWNGGRVELRCELCGDPFLVWPSQPRHKGKHRFCSKNCYHKWKSENSTGENNNNWKGGYEHYYGANWLTQRQKARERAGYKCQHCNVHEKKLTRQLDVHHITPFREFNGDYKKANRLSNLVALCQVCHAKAECNKIHIQPHLL